jgi:hypothetical protein
MASEPVDFPPDADAHSLDSPESIPITGTTVAAFIGRTERGPLNKPIAIASFDEFGRAFGGFCAFSFVPHAVQHFFQHGGTRAVVVRIVNRASRASLEIPCGAEVWRLQALQPGSREFLRVSVDYDRVERDPRRFNLVVQRLSRPGSKLVDDQELFPALSLDPTDHNYIAAALRTSELVRLTAPLPSCRPDATRARRPGDAIPYLETRVAGSDGEELTDYDIIGSNDEGTGLFALDRCPRIDLVCIPSPPGRDLGSTTFVAATRYCERRRALLVWDPPWSWLSPDAAILSVRSTEQTSQNAVTYFPRVQPKAERARYPSGMPACGVVAGILAAADKHGVWHRMPLGDAGLKGHLGPLVDLGAKQVAVLNRVGVNTLVRAHAGSAALVGNVSFAGAKAVSGLWQRLDTKRTALFIVRSIEEHTRWALTAPASDLPLALERQVWVFLARLHREGALVGNSPDQAFFVRTAQMPGRETVVLKVGVALQRPSDFVVYEFNYRERPGLTRAVVAGAPVVLAASSGAP